MVVLVPRQLRFTGMTGNVPYYGGRFTPAQAYAASHRPPPPAHPVEPSDVAPSPQPDVVASLDQLLEAGVLDRQEYDRLRARIDP